MPVTTSRDTRPFWTDGASLPDCPPLDRDLTVDVAIVGGGMTGLTTAYLLKQAGLHVAVLEKGRCAQGETSHTTAHLAAVTDTPFAELSKSLGSDHAQAVWDAGFAAIAEIDAIVAHEGIECGFRWLPGYLHASLDAPADAAEAGRQVTRLREEARTASEAGFDATYLDAIPLQGLPGVRFESQARLHPLKYLAALVRAVQGDGSYVFEHSPVDEMHDDPLALTALKHRVTAGYVVIATHQPLMGNTNVVSATLLQTDLYAYSTYALAARLPHGRLPEALFWDMSDPYYYLRVDAQDDREDVLIFGGADHKTGQTDDTREHFARVEATLAEILPEARVTHRWSGQIIETRDGLPYIGETSKRQFVATGFAGNGITFATVSAIMARDAATGRPNPWRELFDVGRTGVTRGLWNYLTENKDYPYYMVRDRFAGPEGKSIRALARGEGRILELDGRRVAAYRDRHGAATLLSPICTHMACLVDWNEAESTWDCPCHGSRFGPTGDVIAGPAETPLEKIDKHST